MCVCVSQYFISKTRDQYNSSLDKPKYVMRVCKDSLIRSHKSSEWFIPMITFHSVVNVNEPFQLK